jgi:hypothetical protein
MLVRNLYEGNKVLDGNVKHVKYDCLALESENELNTFRFESQTNENYDFDEKNNEHEDKKNLHHLEIFNNNNDF